jgi:hypothetical protein
MSNGLLAKNGIIVTGSIEVQNAVTASAFSGDGSALTGVATDISSLNTFTSSIQSEVDTLTAATSSYITEIISTSSLLTTASVSSNTITFTKGDDSTFDVTVDTGSGGGGGGLTTASLGLTTSTDPDEILGWRVEYRQVWDLGASNGFGVNNALGTGHPTGLWFKPDGTKAYATARSPRTLYQVDLDTAWDLTSINLSTEIEKPINGSTGLDGGVGPSTPYNLYVKPDGKSFFIIDYNQRDLVEYTCSIAWDLSTYDTAAVRHIRTFEDLNTDGSDFYPRGIYFKPDGTKLFVTNGQASQKNPDIITFDLSTAWDITTATQNTSQSLVNNFTINPYSEDPADTGSVSYIPSDPPNTIAFNTSGSIMYTAGNAETLQQYTLSTPWDITTARIKEAYTVDRLNQVIEQNQNNTMGESYTDPSALYINAEAGYAYMLFHGGDEVIRFTMGDTVIENNVVFDKNLYVNGMLRSEGGIHSAGGALIEGTIKTGAIYGGQFNFSTINASYLYAGNNSFNMKNPQGVYSFGSSVNQNSIFARFTSSVTENRNITIPDKDGTLMLDTDLYYIGRYNTNAQTYVENSGSLEFYYTARADGQGEYSKTKGAVAVSGQTLNRRIFYSDRAFSHPDSSSQWTEYTNGTGDISLDTAKNLAFDLLNFRETGSIPLSFKSSIENHLTDSLYNTSSMGLAYGLRRLSHVHTGYAIQVENDSNVTLDIGFDNDGNLDTGSILTHIGSGEGYVTKWYDQSPNQNDAYYDNTYTYAGDKPKIATGGAMVTDNGKPAIDTSVGGAFVMTNEYSTGTSDFLMTVVANKTSTNSNQGMIIGTQVGNDNRFWLVSSYVNWQINAGSSNHSFASPNNVNIYTLGQQLYTVNHNGSSTTIDRNGIVSTNSGYNRAGPFRATLLFNAWNNVNYEFKGKIQEIIIFEQSSSKADIVSNTNSYYNIY